MHSNVIGIYCLGIMTVLNAFYDLPCCHLQCNLKDRQLHVQVGEIYAINRTEIFASVYKTEQNNLPSHLQTLFEANT